MKKLKWYDWLIIVALVGSIIIFVISGKKITPLFIVLMVIISLLNSRVRSFFERRKKM